MTAKVVAFYNNKGGVGKTTSTTNVAGVLSQRGKQVLVIDTDPQSDVIKQFGGHQNNIKLGTGDVLASVDNLDAEDIHGVFMRVAENLDVLPATKKLRTFIADATARERMAIWEKQSPDSQYGYLEKAVNKIKDDYDYILIDMAPADDVILKNVIPVVDDFIVVTQADLTSMEDAKEILEVTDENKIIVRSILPTMVDMREAATKNYFSQLDGIASKHGVRLAKNYINKSAAYKDAVGGYQLPLTLTDDTSATYKRARPDYFEFVDELGY